MDKKFMDTSLKVSKAQADSLIESWGRYAYSVRILQEVGDKRLPVQYATIPTCDLHEIIEASTERRYGMAGIYQHVGGTDEYNLKERLSLRVGKVWYYFFLDGTK